MLRESVQMSGQAVDVASVTRGFEAGAGIPHAAALAEFAEAVVLRDQARVTAGRAVLGEALGAAGLVDAAATVAAFHGFVRLADAIGIPYTTAARGQDVPDLRAAAGIDAFYRVRSGG